MVSFSFAQISALCMVVSGLSGVLGIPAHHNQHSAGYNQTTAPSNATVQHAVSASAPHFVVYTDRYQSGVTGPPPVADVKGWNVVVLAFLLTSGAFDKAQEWTSLSAAERQSIKSEYQAAGISLMVSAFGSTDTPTSSGADPTALAGQMAQFVKDYDLDGIDVDYEDFGAFDARDGTAETWLIAFTKELRAQLPQGQYIITHAPVAPWFAPNLWGGGGYTKVHQEVGDMIDWYNMQFYNQNDYTDCSSLLTKSGSTWPGTSVFEIAANGVPLDKVVIGKPAGAADANNGFMDPATLAGCVQEAKAQNWNGGVMAWQYPNADASWIGTVRSQAFPV